MSNQADIKRKTIGDVCRFVLFATQNKKPIKKSDISAIIRKANIAKSTEIIEAVKTKLATGFGFKLVEAPNKTQFFLVVQNQQIRDDNQRDNHFNLRGRLLNNDKNIAAYRGFISLILQLLILHGGECQKDIFDHLIFDKFDTSCFGSQKQIIQNLKQEKWIEETKINQDDRVFYKLGIRANIETLSEWQYIAAFQTINGMKPAPDDRALQRIVKDKQVQNRQSNNNRRSGRGKGKGRGRRR